jgi:phage/conjugal plasmid C-4 type zinc finger TraR family protein
MSFELNDEMAQAITEQYFQSSLNSILSQVRTDMVSRKYCEECGSEIPEARRKAVRGVRFCTGCQDVLEHLKKTGCGVTNGR